MTGAASSAAVVTNPMDCPPAASGAPSQAATALAAVDTVRIATASLAHQNHITPDETMQLLAAEKLTGHPSCESGNCLSKSRRRLRAPCSDQCHDDDALCELPDGRSNLANSALDITLAVSLQPTT
jgi:hypothetical protein